MCSVIVFSSRPSCQFPARVRPALPPATVTSGVSIAFANPTGVPAGLDQPYGLEAGGAEGGVPAAEPDTHDQLNLMRHFVDERQSDDEFKEQ